VPADRFDDVPMSPVLALHVDRNDGVRRRDQQQNVENQPQNRAKDAQNEVENGGEGLPVQQQAKRGHHGCKEVNQGSISGQRMSRMQDLGDLTGSAIASPTMG
jgi:hypothetical protein